MFSRWNRIPGLSKITDIWPEPSVLSLDVPDFYQIQSYIVESCYRVQLWINGFKFGLKIYSHQAYYHHPLVPVHRASCLSHLSLIAHAYLYILGMPVSLTFPWRCPRIAPLSKRLRLPLLTALARAFPILSYSRKPFSIPQHPYWAK